MFAEASAGCTGTGIHPPGAWVTLEDSIPNNRGIEGPVKSISRTPTEWPAREKESASWVVIEDFPTPPLPDSTLQNALVEDCGKKGKEDYQDNIFDFV